MEKQYKVIRNGAKQSMGYDDICRELGILPGINFVKVTTRGTISYTAGKQNEIRYLRGACEKAGFVPSKALKEA